MTKSSNADTAAPLADRAVFVAGGTSGVNMEIARSFARVVPGAIAVSRTPWHEAGLPNSPPSDPQQTGGHQQETVLVVDDDPTLQTMILDYFVDNNIQTLLASGRPVARRWFVSSPRTRSTW